MKYIINGIICGIIVFTIIAFGIQLYAIPKYKGVQLERKYRIQQLVRERCSKAPIHTSEFCKGYLYGLVDDQKELDEDQQVLLEICYDACVRR